MDGLVKSMMEGFKISGKSVARGLYFQAVHADVYVVP